MDTGKKGLEAVAAVKADIAPDSEKSDFGRQARIARELLEDQY